MAEPAQLSDYTNAVNTVMQPIAYEAMNRRQYRRWEKERDKTWERENQIRGEMREQAINDWHMQNLYNSPKEQRKRLEAAGLNPALMYKSGTVNQGADIRSTTNPNTASKDVPEAVMPPNMGTSGALVMSQLNESAVRADMGRQAIRNSQLENILKTLDISDKAMDVNTKSATFQSNIRKLQDLAWIVGQEKGAKNQLFLHLEKYYPELLNKLKMEIEKGNQDINIKKQIEKNLGYSGERMRMENKIFSDTGVSGNSDAVNIFRMLMKLFGYDF